MRREIACLFLLLSLGWLTGCVKKETTWSLHNTPACSVSTSSLELDRERTYLATLLALHERGYTLLRTQAPSTIEATFTSGSSPGVAHVRWLIGVGPDASLTVDVPPTERQMHPRVAAWYERLLVSVNQLQCRDPNWLRWEAQNKGLAPIGAYAGPDEGNLAGGGENVTASSPVPPRPPVQVHPNAERLLELNAERGRIHFVRSFVWAGIGAGALGLGVVYGIYGGVFWAAGCTEDFDGSRDCTLRDTGHILVPVGAGLAALGGTMLAIALPRAISGLQRHRALGREIKLLRSMSLSFAPPASATPRAWGLGVRGTF